MASACLDWNGFCRVTARRKKGLDVAPPAPPHQQPDYLKWSLKSVADRGEIDGGRHEYSIFISISVCFISGFSFFSFFPEDKLRVAGRGEGGGQGREGGAKKRLSCSRPCRIDFHQECFSPPEGVCACALVSDVSHRMCRWTKISSKWLNC